MTGNIVNLGTAVADGEDLDRIVAAGLTYNSQAETVVSIDSAFELRGDSRSEGFLILASGGQMTAADDATFASVGAVNLSDVDNVFAFEISRPNQAST